MCDTGLPVGLLAAAAGILQGDKWAKSTVSTVNSQQRTFMEFCKLYGVTSMPVSGDCLVNYVCWLLLSGRITTVGSAKQYLSAVSTLHKLAGESCVTPTEYPALKFTLDGMKRRFAFPPRRSLPITPAILLNLLNTRLHHSASWATKTTLAVMRCLCSVMFTSMLRSSNLIPPYPAAADPRRQLTWNKIRRLKNGAILAIPLEKTLQFSERLHEIPLAAKPGSVFCPVWALDQLIELRGGKDCIRHDDLVFVVPGGAGKWRPLVKYEFKEWLDVRFAQMGLEPGVRRIHGFRHGGINQAILSESNLQLVKISSNHLSDCINAYSHIPPARRFQVSSKMIEAMSVQLSTGPVQ